MAQEPQAPTKGDLLEALRSSGQQALERLRALPTDTFEEGRYESGWNGRQILAHIASIEWTYPRLIDIARDAHADTPPRPARDVESAEHHKTTDLPTRTAQGGILSYNDRQVEKRANATVEELLMEFETNRAATIAAVETADDALFEKPIRSAGGVTGSLASVLNAVAVLHVVAHTNDIAGAPTRA